MLKLRFERYIMAKFDYAKHDLNLAAHGGVLLQQFALVNVCMGRFLSRLPTGLDKNLYRVGWLAFNFFFFSA